MPVLFLNGCMDQASFQHRRHPWLILHLVVVWHTGNVAERFNEVRRRRLVLGCVTVFGRLTTLVFQPSHPGQISLLPLQGREMNTSQSAVMLCGWGVKAGMAYSTCG